MWNSIGIVSLPVWYVKTVLEATSLRAAHYLHSLQLKCKSFKEAEGALKLKWVAPNDKLIFFLDVVSPSLVFLPLRFCKAQLNCHAEACSYWPFRNCPLLVSAEVVLVVVVLTLCFWCYFVWLAESVCSYWWLLLKADFHDFSSLKKK